MVDLNGAENEVCHAWSEISESHTKPLSFFIKALREDMNEISSRIDEVTELATDWAQNSDPSTSQRLTNEMTVLSERFRSVSTRLIKKEKELEDILVKWQRFESSCSDLLAWIENQTDVLNETVTVDVSLTLQLQQLAICQVGVECSRFLFDRNACS